MECSEIHRTDFVPECCDANFPNQKFSFKNRKCFKEGIYFGDVVSYDGETLEVVCKNGNQYMEGLIFTYIFHEAD